MLLQCSMVQFDSKASEMLNENNVEQFLWWAVWVIASIKINHLQ